MGRNNYIFLSAKNSFRPRFTYTHNVCSRMFNPYDTETIKNTYLLFFGITTVTNLLSISLIIYLNIDSDSFVNDSVLGLSLFYLICSTAYNFGISVACQGFNPIENIDEASIRVQDLRIALLSILQTLLMLIATLFMYFGYEMESTIVLFASSYTSFWKCVFTCLYTRFMHFELKILVLSSLILESVSLLSVSFVSFLILH